MVKFIDRKLRKKWSACMDEDSKELQNYEFKTGHYMEKKPQKR